MTRHDQHTTSEADSTHKLRRRMLSRREFLDSTARNAAGVAAFGVMGSPETASASAAEQVGVAVVGVRNQGKLLARTLADCPDASVVALCDIDSGLLRSVARTVADDQGRAPDVVADYRRVLDRSDVDAVVIATPDHWHAAMAADTLQAGKALYLESPVTHTLEQSRELLALQAETQGVVQCGLPQRSAPHFRSAIEFLRAGKLGPIRLAKAWTTHRRRSIGREQNAGVPEGVDYTAWLGPADAVPFRANRFHYHWRWYWEFGSGELGNWGVHLLDVARWGLEVEWPERVSSVGGKLHFDDDQETPDTQQVFFDFGDRTITWEHRQWSHHANEGRSAGVAFYGERGTLIIDRGGWKVYGTKTGTSEDGGDSTVAHCRDFLDAVRNRHTPTADLAIGHVSSGLCHLGNAAQRAGREVVVSEVLGEHADDRA